MRFLKKSLLLAILLFSACTPQQVSEPVVLPSCSDFSAFENLFYKEAENRRLFLLRRNVTFSFTESEGMLCGESKIAVGCTINGSVRFSRPYWNRVSCTGKEIIFFHEMGHVIGRVHEAPPSIMQPDMMDEFQYMQNRDKWLSNMFKVSL